MTLKHVQFSGRLAVQLEKRDSAGGKVMAEANAGSHRWTPGRSRQTAAGHYLRSWTPPCPLQAQPPRTQHQHQASQAVPYLSNAANLVCK